MDFGQPAVIALEKSQQHVGEIDPRRLVEAAHDAEIDGTDPALLIDHHIARMLVAMKKTVAESLLEEDRRGARQNEIDIVSCRNQRGTIVHATAGQPLLGQHAPCAARPIDLRPTVSWILGASLHQLIGGGSFKPQIHLELDLAGEALDRGDGAKTPQARLRLLDNLGQPAQKIHIAPESMLDVWAKDLDRDFPADRRL